MGLSARFVELLSDVARRLFEAQRPIRILRAIAWPDSVMREFFGGGAQQLPRPAYPSRDLSSTFAELRAIRALVPGDNEAERLVRDTCDSWEAGARLLAAVGTRDFYARSVECYGRPSSLSSDGKTTNLELAEHFDRVMFAYANVDLGGHARPIGADEVAAQLDARLRAYFTDDPIRCEVAETLSANAVTSAELVRVKRGSSFTERDVDQLLVHEGHVHLGTTLNGRKQPILTFLATGAPRTTRTQEGLAIFAEMITRAMDLDRLRRLTDRILAVKMSEEGADFVELYRFFLDRGHAEIAAFDCARRVIRGGLVEGGAPFTKDIVYLDGLLRVSEFLRVALVRGRPQYVRLLFAGKLALEDVPLVDELSRESIVAPARYVPPWASDLGFLTAYMSFSAFLQTVDTGASAAYYDERVESASRIRRA